MSHPRVLHLGFHPVGAPTNSGITLGTMFAGWPEDRLLQVCLRAHPGQPVPRTAVVAPPAVAPLDALVRMVLGRRMPPGAVDGLNNSVARTERLPVRTRARLVATVVNDLGPVRLPPRLVDRIARFGPEVLHSLLGGVRPMRLALALSERFGVPIVPHFMDDWPDNLFRHGQLGGYARSATERDLARVLRRAPLGLAVGADMQRELEARFEMPCPVVGNSADLEAYDRLIGRTARADRWFVLRYVGGLHLGRDQVVRSVAAAVEARTTGARDWRLELFVPPADEARARAVERDFRCVRHRGSLAPRDVPAALVAAHALLFTESTRPEVARFTRLSVSTKVPDYLASGRPVLVVGPRGQGSVRALLRSRSGTYAADAGAESLGRALAGLEEAVRAGHPAARDPWLADEFGTAATRARLLAALSAAAGAGLPGAGTRPVAR